MQQYQHPNSVQAMMKATNHRTSLIMSRVALVSAMPEQASGSLVSAKIKSAANPETRDERTIVVYICEQQHVFL